MLCTQVMNGISSSLKVLPFTAGKEFDVVLVSFDPRDTPEAANSKKRAHLDRWAARDTSDGWHFLTGEERRSAKSPPPPGSRISGTKKRNSSRTSADCSWRWPTARCRGISTASSISPKDLRLALVDSGNGKVGSVIDELLLYCYQYDPSHGQYGAVFMNIMRLGGVLTVGLIAGFIVLMRRRESRARAERHA